FGGLAVVHALLRQPGSFDAYIAIDPSPWCDNKELIGNLGHPWYRPVYDGKLLFLAKADDSGSGEHNHSDTWIFHGTLDQLGPEPKVQWQHDFYAGEEHSTVIGPAVFDALRFSFRGYQMPEKRAMKNPSGLQGHFDAISRRFGSGVK